MIEIFTHARLANRNGFMPRLRIKELREAKVAKKPKQAMRKSIVDAVRRRSPKSMVFRHLATLMKPLLRIGVVSSVDTPHFPTLARISFIHRFCCRERTTTIAIVCRGVASACLNKLRLRLPLRNAGIFVSERSADVLTGNAFGNLSQHLRIAMEIAGAFV